MKVSAHTTIKRYSLILGALNNRKYYKSGSNEKVIQGRWELRGHVIAEHRQDGTLRVNWHLGAFRKVVIFPRMKALAQFFGLPVPLIEDGWVTVRLGKNPLPVSNENALTLARHLFYSESGVNVEEAVFDEIFRRQKAGEQRMHWLRENPKQGMIWDVCKRITIAEDDATEGTENGS